MRWSGVTHGEGWWTCHAHAECYVETKDWDVEWDEHPGWDRPSVRMYWPKTGEEWHPMRTAPRDGTMIEVLIYHRNRRYAPKHEKHEWTGTAQAYWSDHNHGGWVWMGMMGQFRGWRPIKPKAGEEGA